MTTVHLLFDLFIWGNCSMQKPRLCH